MRTPAYTSKIENEGMYPDKGKKSTQKKLDKTKCLTTANEPNTVVVGDQRKNGVVIRPARFSYNSKLRERSCASVGWSELELFLVESPPRLQARDP